MLARILYFIFWLLILWWAAWLGRRILLWLAGQSAHPRGRATPPVSRQPLHRDPVCGTFVAAEISQTLEQGGKILHFCSTACRERFLRSERRAASA